MTQPTNQNTTVIGPDAHFKGEMSFDGAAKILGTFDGSITSKGEISVGQGATCNATVHAARVVVDGTVNGDVQGDELIELNNGAKVTGDITAGNLVVVEGASFEGHCKVGPNAGVKRVAPAPAQPVTERPRIETRSMRPASVASESAASPGAATAAVARATAGAAGNTSWLKGEATSKDEQNAA